LVIICPKMSQLAGRLVNTWSRSFSLGTTIHIFAS
jgi:hypothetical protein